jgi:hypothetical protein
MDRKATKGLVGGGGTDIGIAVGYRVWWWLVGFIVLAAMTGPGCSSNQVPPAGSDSGVDSGIGPDVDGAVECAPFSLIRGGADTGLDVCTNGNLQRRASVQCSWPATTSVRACDPSTCASDDDCAVYPPTQPKGYCAQAHNLLGYCGCYSGCREDADCGPGWICECASLPVGQCVKAQCATNADCGAGYACVVSVEDTSGSACTLNPTLSSPVFVCQTAADGCRGSTDCSDGAASANENDVCLYDGTRRTCRVVCQPAAVADTQGVVTG